MRITRYENYPGQCDVYLDGVKRENVMACDVEEGYVEVADIKAPMLMRDELPVVTKHGVVRIELNGAQHPKPLPDNERRVEAKRALRRYF